MLVGRMLFLLDGLSRLPKSREAEVLRLVASCVERAAVGQPYSPAL